MRAICHRHRQFPVGHRRPKGMHIFCRDRSLICLALTGRAVRTVRGCVSSQRHVSRIWAKSLKSLVRRRWMLRFRLLYRLASLSVNFDSRVLHYWDENRVMTCAWNGNKVGTYRPPAPVWSSKTVFASRSNAGERWKENRSHYSSSEMSFAPTQSFWGLFHKIELNYKPQIGLY